MNQPPPDWQTLRAQARANALPLLATEPCAAQLQAIVSEVIEELANAAPETAENSFTQGGGAASIANRLREGGFIEWANDVQRRVNFEQGLEARGYAVEILVGRAAGLLCGANPGEREFTFVRGLREVFPFNSADFIPAAETVLKSDAGRIEKLAAMLNQRAATFQTEPRRSVALSDRELTKASREQSWETRFIDIWDNQLDRTMIWLYDFDAYELLRRVDYGAYLSLLEDFPSRGFPYQLLDVANERATSSELCLLLKHARPVFEQNGAWIKQNRVAFIVLNLLAGRLVDQPFEEGQPSESFKDTLTEIVETLMERSDATPLAYAWLQRVLMSPGKSRRHAAKKDDDNFRSVVLLVAATLAPHLGPPQDPLAWIEAEFYVWRNWRIYALLAIALSRQPPDNSAIADLIANALIGELVSSVAIDRLGQGSNIERTIISNAISHIPDVTLWFTELWKRLYWQRNRFKWIRHNGATRPNVGQVIVLWGICGLELLPAASEEARSLWLALYRAVSESLLTEAFRQHNDAWSLALRFLGAFWLRTFPDDPSAGSPGSLESLISPWKRIDIDFAQLIEVLDRFGVQPEQLCRDGVSGDMLRKIIEASYIGGKTLLDQQEISAINAVAERLDEFETPSIGREPPAAG